MGVELLIFIHRFTTQMDNIVLCMSTDEIKFILDKFNSFQKLQFTEKVGGGKGFHQYFGYDDHFEGEYIDFRLISQIHIFGEIFKFLVSII